MKTSDLDFDLPMELIAQSPAPQRPESHLLHYRRADRSITHRAFAELPSLLKRGDLLVFNDTRVLPARFTLVKETGGRVEGLFLDEPRPGEWDVLLKNTGPAPEATIFQFAETQIQAKVIARGDGGQFRLSVESGESAAALLERIGRMPLPPYIKRDKLHDARDNQDRERYQTVYAKQPGSVAAPTAGLHFSDEIFQALDSTGVQRTFVTLNVGLGTFKPVTAETLEAHEMHVESYSISRDAANAVSAAKRDGRRLIAVGTTSARVLESQPADQPLLEKRDSTQIFIYPPYQWKWIDALITNFHLPRSTLIALVAAMVGLDEQRRIYQTAIEQRYRFFSYGDAMFIE